MLEYNYLLVHTYHIYLYTYNYTTTLKLLPLSQLVMCQYPNLQLGHLRIPEIRLTSKQLPGLTRIAPIRPCKENTNQQQWVGLSLQRKIYRKVLSHCINTKYILFHSVCYS